MINHGNLLRCACLVLVIMIAMAAAGCCGRIRKKPVEIIKKTVVIDEAEEQMSETTEEASGSQTKADRRQSKKPSDKDKVTAALYQRLENSFAMFQTDNIDGAQRELDRVQLEINDDPYLEMQTWYLAAMISHKSGKTSRRKRAMRKMLETMEQLQKDPRFLRSFEDGMVSQEVIKMAIDKGEGRYAE